MEPNGAQRISLPGMILFVSDNIERRRKEFCDACETAFQATRQVEVAAKRLAEAQQDLEPKRTKLQSASDAFLAHKQEYEEARNAVLAASNRLDIVRAQYNRLLATEKTYRDEFNPLDDKTSELTVYLEQKLKQATADASAYGPTLSEASAANDSARSKEKEREMVMRNAMDAEVKAQAEFNAAKKAATAAQKAYDQASNDSYLASQACSEAKDAYKEASIARLAVLCYTAFALPSGANGAALVEQVIGDFVDQLAKLRNQSGG